MLAAYGQTNKYSLDAVEPFANFAARLVGSERGRKDTASLSLECSNVAAIADIVITRVGAFNVFLISEIGFQAVDLRRGLWSGRRGLNGRDGFLGLRFAYRRRVAHNANRTPGRFLRGRFAGGFGGMILRCPFGADPCL